MRLTPNGYLRRAGEEEFQRNKAKLRAAARDKLKEIMEKKGKLAEFDSEVRAAAASHVGLLRRWQHDQKRRCLAF